MFFHCVFVNPPPIDGEAALLNDPISSNTPRPEAAGVKVSGSGRKWHTPIYRLPFPHCGFGSVRGTPIKALGGGHSIHIALEGHCESPKDTRTMDSALYAAKALKDLRINRIHRPGRPWTMMADGTIEAEGESKQVVVKTYRKINETTYEKVAERTHREVSLLAALQGPPGSCPNINHFYGVTFLDSSLLAEALPNIPSIVVDFVMYDSLEYTHGRDFEVKVDIVRQLGNGLSYMHALGLVHGDVRPDNFRVTEDGVVKIIDFGLGRYESNERTGFTTTIMPCYRFIAPELIIPDEDDVSMHVTKATDVWAFSMTALQVLDGREFNESRPFNRCGQPYAVRRAINLQEWPQAQDYSGVTPEAWGVISACWTPTAAGRPTIDALLKSLAGIPISV